MAMLTPEERALFIDTQDQLIALCVQHDEASRAEDWGKAGTLEAEIDVVRARMDELRRFN
jgi:hypothetical protein